MVIKVLECIFWGSNFNVHRCFVMYFLREQFWKAFLSEQFPCVPMFWNVFFEGAILRCIFWTSNFNVLKYIFWGSNLKDIFEWAILLFWNVFFEGAILKCIFWGSNLFRIYGCWIVRLLICFTVLFYLTDLK